MKYKYLKSLSAIILIIICLFGMICNLGGIRVVRATNQLQKQYLKERPRDNLILNTENIKIIKADYIKTLKYYDSLYVYFSDLNKSLNITFKTNIIINILAFLLLVRYLKDSIKKQ